MWTLQARFAPDALSTLDTVLKHTKDVCVFRRAQAVREVVKGHRIKAVSTSFAFTSSALRTWIRRFDEAILWRFALPRACWWRTANRHRLYTGALSPGHIKHHEAYTRQA